MTNYRSLLSDLIQKYRDRADFILIRLEESDSTDILLRGNKIETLSEEVAMGGQVRVCYKGGWGFASFNRLNSLKDRLEDAIAAARLVGTQKTTLAPVPPIEGVYHLPLPAGDPREIPLADKKALCDHYNQLLQGYNSKITTTSVSYSDITQRVTIATSEGTLVEQRWTDLEARFSAIAREGELVQTGRETTG
ncbi:MAG: DNA gyrase modulator, partial [Halothece sp. Uz-M2-17]|nr:DNA gyrase modulator [Halothece sp. Uz-M2-17]